MAYATIKDLLEIDTDEISRLTIADINYEKLKTRAKEFKNSNKISTARCDMADLEGLVRLMKKHDIVINETPCVVSGLKAALKAGIHIIDLGGWIDDTLEQLKLNDKFEKAGLTAILGLGSSPGITNIIASYLVNKMDIAETIRMSFAYAELVKSTLFIPFSGAVDEFVDNSTIFQDGKFVKLPPQSGLEDEQFPEPIGLRKMIYIPHPEVATFPIYFKRKGIKNVSIKAGFTPDFVEKINFLISLGIISRDPLKVKDKTVIPFDLFNACYAKLPPLKRRLDYGCTRVIVKGKKSGDKLEYKAELLNRPYKNLTGVQHRTGHSPAIGAHMLNKGQIKKRGVFPPEACIEPKIFFRELARRELEVSITERYFI